VRSGWVREGVRLEKGPAIRLTFRAFYPLPAGEAPRRRNPVAGKARSNIL